MKSIAQRHHRGMEFAINLGGLVPKVGGGSECVNINGRVATNGQKPHPSL
jgi:hypothetical protein